MKSFFSIRNICFISIFAAIIAVCAQISIPMPAGVPLTLQTFAVALAGIVLGAKKGTAAVSVYVLLGAVGAPVFSGFNGGFATLFGRTGGFILSFPIMTLCIGVFSYMSLNKKLPLKFSLIALGLIWGAAINYICGILMFAQITSGSLYNAFVLCVLPFIPTDIIKLILAGSIGLTIKKIMTKNKVLK